jgi:hypothetical protein
MSRTCGDYVDTHLDSLDDARFTTSYYLSPEALMVYRLLVALWLLSIYITCLLTKDFMINFGLSLWNSLAYFTNLSLY